MNLLKQSMIELKQRDQLQNERVNKIKRGPLAKQMGATPLQFALFGILALGLFYTIFTTFNQGSGFGKSLTIVQTNSGVVTGVKAIVGPRPIYTGLTTQVGAESGKLPTSVIDAAGTGLQTDYGTITLAPTSLNGGTDNGFSVTYTQLPNDVCLTLANSASEEAHTIVRGATTLKDNSTTFSATTASAACNTVADMTISYIGG